MRSAFHLLISVAIFVAVPAIAYGLGGALGFEFIVLGAVIGFAYWYWGPFGLPF